MAQQQRASFLHVAVKSALPPTLDSRWSPWSLRWLPMGCPIRPTWRPPSRWSATVREHGAVPATIAILHGQLHVGLTESELEFLATARNIRKVSRRDLPVVVAQQSDGATTVAATATVAAWAGIKVFSTGALAGYTPMPHSTSRTTCRRWLRCRWL